MNKLFFLLLTNLFIFSTSYGQCTINNAIDCECADLDQNDCDLLPDITVCWQTGINGSQEYAPGEGLQDGEINYPENWFEITPEVQEMGRIRISARTPNIGVGPLTLRGADQYGYRHMVCYNDGVADTFTVYDPEWQISTDVCPDGTNPKHISWQRIYHKNSDGSMSFYEEMVGTMEYHPTHGHMHFDEWTIMTLRIPDPNNMDNPLEWETIGDGAKVGFCVMDLGNCSSENAGCRDDESVYNEGNLLSEDDFPNYGLGGGSYGCSPVEQGISSGYNDTYGSYLDGMFLNIPLGTCNGEYAVVLEVPQVMVEARLDNNYTWFPITLTMQTEGPNIPEIISSIEGNICEGDEINLSIDVSDNSTILWSNGSTNESTVVNSFGTYSVTVSTPDSECATTKYIELNGINTPEIDDVTICLNTPTELSIESDYLVTWYDENMNTVGNGNTYSTANINENVTYYVSNTYAENQVGPEEHNGASNYSGGNDAIGFLSFDALSPFTLESVKVYSDLPAERTFILMTSNGDVIAEHTELIGYSENEPQTVILNFDIPIGEGYIIGTDGDVNENNIGSQNPRLKRTGTGGNLSYPYQIDGIVSINNSIYYGSGFDGSMGDEYTNYYYYLYDWQIATEATTCISPFSITVNGSNTTTSESSCDSFEWNGSIYNESGVYSYDYYNELGCLNQEVLLLTINNSSNSFLEVTSCDNYDWNGINYTESGQYSVESINEFGCAQTDVLSLSIESSTSSSEEVTSCDNYEWNGINYTESGQYSFESINEFGCTHTDYLSLTINNSTSSFENMTSCESFEWNGVTYTESGEYVFESMNEIGCVNTNTLILTILNNSVFEEIDTVICDELNWNGIDYNSSGTYFYESVNELGCTYTSNLNLTVNYSSGSNEQITSCESFEWNGDVFTESGEYFYETINEFGCSNTDTLSLLINETLTYSENISSCESYEWNGEFYTESGTYNYVTTSSFGCDSTSTLILTVLPLVTQNNIIGSPNVTEFSIQSYSIEDNGNSFEWSVTGGVIISNNNNNVEIQWAGAGEGIITVLESNGECDFLNTYSIIIDGSQVESWNCVNDFCVDPLDGSGVYEILSNCQEICENHTSLSEKSVEILIYPNPSKGIFNLELYSIKNSCQLLVTNLLGKKIYSETINSADKQSTQIDLSDYSSGVYNLSLIEENLITNYRLILN